MKAIVNGKIITQGSILADKILIIDGDRIAGFANSIDPAGFERVVNAHGRYVMPGFIDIHSDRIEQFIQPRPTALMGFELGMKACERELLSQGITTMYHSLSLCRDEFFGAKAIRQKENVKKLADLIGDIHNRYHLIHHRFHLRIEIDNLDAFDIAKEMIESHLVHEISFMDHTPGQGQYKSLEVYEKTLSGYGGSEYLKLGFEGVLEYHEHKETLTFHQLKELAALAHEHGIAVASHDDDCVEKLEINRRLGVDISEFPITLQTARAAKTFGFYTVVGAPNILLGGSHSGNMSAAEAIEADCADILCSDYYPAALLHGVFIMHENFDIPLWEMAKKVSLNPAKAVRLDGDYGSLDVGKKADILIVEVLDGYPVITHALVDGVLSSRVEYRR